MDSHGPELTIHKPSRQRTDRLTQPTVNHPHSTSAPLPFTECIRNSHTAKQAKKRDESIISFDKLGYIDESGRNIDENQDISTKKRIYRRKSLLYLRISLIVRYGSRSQTLFLYREKSLERVLFMCECRISGCRGNGMTAVLANFCH